MTAGFQGEIKAVCGNSFSRWQTLGNGKFFFFFFFLVVVVVCCCVVVVELYLM